jgi:hypothetical protein
VVLAGAAATACACRASGSARGWACCRGSGRSPARPRSGHAPATASSLWPATRSWT